MTDIMRLAPAEAERFTTAVLEKAGLRASDAATAARAIVEADLAGVDTHGIIRLPMYVAWLGDGRIDPRAEIEVERTMPAVALLDGRGAMGHLCMTRAAEIAADAARTYGIGWVGLRNSNHAGAIGIYAARLAREGFISICGAVSAINQVAPWGGSEPLMGTNPIAFAVPGEEEAPVVFDMATTIASLGMIKKYAMEGRPMPEGWIVDREGRPMTDASRHAEGLLLPVGEHKGSGLALMIGLIAAVANGADFGRGLGEGGRPVSVGQFVLALDGRALAPGFREKVDEIVRDFGKSAPVAGGGPVRVPGVARAEKEAERRIRGIPIPAPLMRELALLADRSGVAHPAYAAG
jgi:LDH2 family malate/lactate/ureidoglycolate dehydrogenase